MTELGLLLVIHSSGLLFALALARMLAGKDGTGPEWHRLSSALGRAADSFLSQEFRLVALAAGVLCPVAFALYAVLLSPGSGLGGLEIGFWAAIGLAIGALATCLTAKLSARLAVRGSLRALAAAQKNLDRAVSVTMRAGGAIGLFVETSCVTSLLAVFGLLFAMKGGFRAGATEAGSLGAALALLMPCYGLGVAVAALILGRGGAIYHTASDLGADLAGERAAGLDHDDPRNPAVIADLVGDHVGLSVGRAVDTFLSTTIANVTAVIVAVTLSDVARGGAPLALVALPLVARAFGVIASGFGVMVVRTDEPENTATALWRGQAVTAVIALAGAAGSALWLIGDASWSRFFWAAALGVVAATIAAHAARYRIDRRVGPLRELIETQKVAEPPGVGLGIGTGFESALIPVLVTGLAMTGAWHLGASTGLAGGGVLGALSALMTLSASTPYHLALATFGPIADGARGASSMIASAAVPEAQRRTSRLDDAGFAASAVSQTFLIVEGSLSAVLAAGALPMLMAKSPSTTSPIDLREPAVLWSGALGLAAVLAYAGSTVRAATRGARGVVQEVDRQLKGFAQEKGRRAVPLDYTPSYKNCVELAASAALRRLIVPVLLGLSLPLALGLGLRLLFRNTGSALPLAALAAFVVVGAAAAMAHSLSMDGTRASLSAARRASRRGREEGGFSAALSGDAMADLLGDAAGPAAQLLIKSAAVVTLLVAPFIGGSP